MIDSSQPQRRSPAPRTQGEGPPHMPAKDIAGVAGVIFVLTSGVAIFAELTDSVGATLQTLRLAAYGIAAVLLLVAFVVHRRERRPASEAVVLPGGRTVPGQRRHRTSVRSR